MKILIVKPALFSGWCFHRRYVFLILLIVFVFMATNELFHVTFVHKNYLAMSIVFLYSSLYLSEQTTETNLKNDARFLGGLL